MPKSTIKNQNRTGPLNGLRIIEFKAIGPAPFACMLLSDLGADVVVIARTSDKPIKQPILERNRRIVALDLKTPEGCEQARALVTQADIVIEGFRPGVMEKLGLGPDVLLAANPQLIYGRMTGWGQSGPLAQTAGHDINYISLTGALAAIGSESGGPVPPLNLVGDYGGGALYLCLGILSALYERQHSGRGQVIDAAMCDGTASLLAIFSQLLAAGNWQLQREANFLDGGAPFYRCYACADQKHIALGPLEDKFWDVFCQKTGIDPAKFLPRYQSNGWQEQNRQLEDLFRQKTQAEWCQLFEGTDACLSPVLTMAEAPDHPHMQARQTYITLDGITQPAPAPRFSRTPASMPDSAPSAFRTVAEILDDWQ